jgi:hypothetical protein
MTGQQEQENAGEDSAGNVTFLSLLQSVSAAAFGVQSEKNRKRDFESGKFWHFVIAGILFVIVFLVLVWAAVQYLLATSA